MFELSSSRLTDTVGDSLVMKVEHSAAEEPSVIQTQNRDNNRVKVGFSNDDHVFIKSTNESQTFHRGGASASEIWLMSQQHLRHATSLQRNSADICETSGCCSLSARYHVAAVCFDSSRVIVN